MNSKNKKVDLHTLYPTALTQDEIYEKTLERRLRQPILPPFARTKVALSLGFICFLLFLFVFNLEYLWSMRLSGVAASFLIMIGVGVGGKLALSYTSRIFSLFTQPASPFLMCCGAGIILLGVAHQFGLLAGVPAPFAALTLSGGFFILALIGLCVLLRRQQ